MGVRRLSAVLVFSCVAFAPTAGLAGPVTFNGALNTYHDVAIFPFELTEGTYLFTAQTTSFSWDPDSGDPTGGFDPTLAFYAPDNTIVIYGDPPGFPARNDDREDGDPLDFNSFLEFQLFVAGGPATYLLALTQSGNAAHEQFGFDWDALSCVEAVGLDPSTSETDCLQGSVQFRGLSPDFSLNVTIEPITAVPEPGTLSLLALGSVCIRLVRRRHARAVARQG